MNSTWLRAWLIDAIRPHLFIHSASKHIHLKIYVECHLRAPRGEKPSFPWSATTKVVLQLMHESFPLIMRILNFQGFPQDAAALIAGRSMWRLKSRLLCGLPSKRNSIKRQPPHFDLKVLIRQRQQQGQQEGHQWQVLCRGVASQRSKCLFKGIFNWNYLMLPFEPRVKNFTFFSSVAPQSLKLIPNLILIDRYTYICMSIYMCIFVCHVCMYSYLTCLQLLYANSTS